MSIATSGLRRRPAYACTVENIATAYSTAIPPAADPSAARVPTFSSDSTRTELDAKVVDPGMFGPMRRRFASNTSLAIRPRTPPANVNIQRHSLFEMPTCAKRSYPNERN